MSDRESNEAAPSGETHAWTVHPARERPIAALATVAVIAAFALAVLSFSESRLWALLAIVVLCLSLSRFFFATRYCVSVERIEVIGLWGRRCLAWSEVRRAEFARGGVWLSTFRRPHRLERRRGLFVLLGREGDRNGELLRGHLPEDVEIRSKSTRDTAH